MKRFALAFAVLSLLACDEDKRKADLIASTKSSADAALPIVPMVTASAVASASAAPVKKEVVCPSGTELALTDADLEAAIRLKLQKPKDPLKASDLANVRSLNLTNKAVLDDLDPCIMPKLTNLKHLYLGKGGLRDLSPIANLTQMESLRASINEVEDLKPLEKMTLMDRLDLGRTHVRDIAPLAAMVNLTELQLDDTQVADLTPLAKATKLEKLSVKHTLVTDVSPLKNLSKLKFLYIEGCAISNLDTLDPLKARGLRIVLK